MGRMGGSPWEYFVLAALMIAPAHGGLALLIVLMVAAGLLLRFVLKRDPGDLSWDWLVAGPLLGYFVFFYLGGVIHGQDFLAPFASMKGNLPLLFVGLSALLLPKSFKLLSANEVGYWSRRAVLLITLAALSVYTIAHMTPGWHSEVIEQAWQGGRGGRLQMYSRNPLMFASMLLALSYLAVMGWRDLSAFERNLAVAALSTGLIVILFWAQGRGAMLVAVPLTFLSLRYVRPQPRTLVLPLLMGVVVVGLMYGLNQDLRSKVNFGVDRLWVGLTSFSMSGDAKDVNVSVRLNMYKFGMKAAAESPWSGYGYQNRFSVVRSSMPGINARHLHNGYLNHLVAGGIPGLMFFFWLLALPALVVHRARSIDPALRYMAAVIFFVMAGTALSTAVLGHYVNSTFYGLLFLTLSRTLPQRKAASSGGLRNSSPV